MVDYQVRGLLNAIRDAFRAAECVVHIDRETGEVTRTWWDYVNGPPAVLVVAHGAGCIAHRYKAQDGFMCTCSPEVSVQRKGS